MEGDELATIETTASFFCTELICFVGDSGVTILSVLNGDLLNDDEDEPIHRRRLLDKFKEKLYKKWRNFLEELCFLLNMVERRTI